MLAQASGFIARVAAFLAYVLFSASAVVAGVCEENGAVEIAGLEVVKAAFLGGKYGIFTQSLGPFFEDQLEELDHSMGELNRVFPNGFDSCTIILQRFEEPGFVQEVTVYGGERLDGYITLYLAAAEVEGQWAILKFNLDTDTSIILDQLR